MKIELSCEGDVVTLTVIDMDESLRGKGEIFSYNGLSIESHTHVMLNGHTVFLPGVCKDGKTKAVCKYPNAKIAQAYLEAFQELVDAYYKTKKTIADIVPDISAIAGVSQDAVLNKIANNVALCKHSDCHPIFKRLSQVINGEYSGTGVVDIDVWTEGSKLFIKCKSIPDALRSKDKLITVNGFTIRSKGVPEFCATSNVLFINGSNISADGRVVSYDFGNAHVAAGYKAAWLEVIELLKAQTPKTFESLIVDLAADYNIAKMDVVWKVKNVRESHKYNPCAKYIDVMLEVLDGKYNNPKE